MSPYQYGKWTTIKPMMYLMVDNQDMSTKGYKGHLSDEELFKWATYHGQIEYTYIENGKVWVQNTILGRLVEDMI